MDYTRDQRHSLALYRAAFLGRLFASAANPHFWEKHGLNELHTHTHKYMYFLLNIPKIRCELTVMQVLRLKVICKPLAIMSPSEKSFFF